jgi:NADH-quinone oxidoreductase subunit F
LRAKVPEDVEIISSPGLGTWHRSPALVIESPKGEAMLFEGVEPSEIDKLASGLSEGGLSGGKPLAEVLPPALEPAPGAPSSPWSAALERGGLPEGWGPDLVEWAVDNAEEALKRVSEVITADRVERREILSPLEEAMADTSKAKVLICDGVGGEVENNLSYSLPLMNPQAVVAGALLAGAICGAKQVIFYLSWRDGGAAGKMEEAVKELPSVKGIRTSVFQGPEHIPSTLSIGRAAAIQGMMLWRAASLYGWEVPEIGDRPCYLVPADLAWKLPWILQEKGGEVPSWAGGSLVGITGCAEGPRLVEMPAGMSPSEMISKLGLHPKGDGSFKALHLGGAGAGPYPLDAAVEKGYEEGAELVLLPSSVCMVKWALYLALRAERSCCGGCSPGRQAPSVAVEVIRSILRGEADAEEGANLELLLASAGELAMCPRLEEILNPLLSSLRNFRDEFEAHAIEGICKAGSCAQLESAAT